MNERTSELRHARQSSWDTGERDVFLADRQDRALEGLHGVKRGLRRAVYAERPELEGRPFHKMRPGGRDD